MADHIFAHSFLASPEAPKQKLKNTPKPPSQAPLEDLLMDFMENGPRLHRAKEFRASPGLTKAQINALPSYPNVGCHG